MNKAQSLTVELTIINKLGLHARAAAKFVKCAMQFQSQIYLSKDGERCDGKSIMSLLMLAAEKGSCVILEVSGIDQDQAMQTLKELIERGFDE